MTRSKLSTRVEFYFGLLSLLLVAFIIPLIVTALECSALLFLAYLYIPVGVAFILHALYEEEKKFLSTSEGSQGTREE